MNLSLKSVYNPRDAKECLHVVFAFRIVLFLVGTLLNLLKLDLYSSNFEQNKVADSSLRTLNLCFYLLILYLLPILHYKSIIEKKLHLGRNSNFNEIQQQITIPYHCFTCKTLFAVSYFTQGASLSSHGLTTNTYHANKFYLSWCKCLVIFILFICTHQNLQTIVVVQYFVCCSTEVINEIKYIMWR